MKEKRRYTVKIMPESAYPILVTDTKTGKKRQYIPGNFIAGCGDLLREAWLLPLYVHAIVWDHY